MAITINGNGTLTGVSVGGLPDGIVDTDMLAANAVATAKIADDAITDAKQNLSGTAKAWVNFAAGDASIRDNFNVSSVTDHGTGDYTVNFSSALADNDYAWFVSAGRGGNQGVIIAVQDTTDMTSSAFRLTTRNTSNNKEDFTHVCAGFFR